MLLISKHYEIIQKKVMIHMTKQSTQITCSTFTKLIQVLKIVNTYFATSIAPSSTWTWIYNKSSQSTNFPAFGSFCVTLCDSMLQNNPFKRNRRPPYQFYQQCFLVVLTSNFFFWDTAVYWIKFKNQIKSRDQSRWP